MLTLFQKTWVLCCWQGSNTSQGLCIYQANCMSVCFFSLSSSCPLQTTKFCNANLKHSSHELEPPKNHVFKTQRFWFFLLAFRSLLYHLSWAYLGTCKGTELVLDFMVPVLAWTGSLQCSVITVLQKPIATAAKEIKLVWGTASELFSFWSQTHSMGALPTKLKHKKGMVFISSICIWFNSLLNLC